ncbi:unnamed protein product [Cladocopium goreaui]|uniref:Prostaglandin F synthase n=1 Tax=Cladocopium goreaui TaxID=2562237 RepID=A0A9P1DVY5_9DINO|nr:unnamed protein product [Cladocopium goreaui]
MMFSVLVLSQHLLAAAELAIAGLPPVPPPVAPPVAPAPVAPVLPLTRALPDLPGVPPLATPPLLPGSPDRALPGAKSGMIDALASDAISTSPGPGMKISIDMSGLHMTADEIRESEIKLKQEEKDEERVQRQEIAFRHEAYNWLKSHKNDIDSSVCKAAGTFFNFKVLTELVKMGGSVNKQMCGEDSGTPLHSAAYWGLSKGVKRIMEELGGDPNLCNAKGLPPVYEACENVDGSSNKETVTALVEGGADLNMEVEGVPLVKVAMQKGYWKAARCLLDAGATWPFVFNQNLRLFGKDYTMPDTPLSNQGAHFHFCDAARTGNVSAVVSYAASGMDIDYGLCWSAPFRWLTSAIGHAAFYQQKDVIKLLKHFGASSKMSEMCKWKQLHCQGSSCFSCFSACEAYQAKDEPLKPFKKVLDPEIAHLLNC